ncbi:MAG TPA: 1,4-alpha-glucan branching protein domain-containing protein, partial [Bacillota bacterium]|nr:1,4-alpha-glucan branching protein domain-containing protein [Bacillota bacterium]
MVDGYLSIVLHAHLPYIKHDRTEKCFEERWLFEAISESYIPLLLKMEQLVMDGVDFRLTISLSPPLLAMLGDTDLMERYDEELERTIKLANAEKEREQDEAFTQLATAYSVQYRNIQQFMRRYHGNLLSAFKKMKELGKLELITSCATHGYLPLLKTEEAIRAQIEVGVRSFEQSFGWRPSGLWLPECGYTPGVDRIAKECGIDYVLVDEHTVKQATPTPCRGIYAPLETEYGVAAFARDPACANQVWSMQEGYPGDPDYREYYRDIGYDREWEYIRPYLHPSGIRLNTGIKYYRITGSGEKEVYNPSWAKEKAALHAGHFFDARIQQVKEAQWFDRKPLLVATYDAELFGHWWYEGPQFLDYLFRKFYYDQNTLQLITPSEYLQHYPKQDTGRLPLSSWGRNRYSEVWLEGSNAWLYRHLHQGEKRMIQLVERFWNDNNQEVQRMLRQAGRELLLAQSSDWAFIMENRTTVDYAIRRFKTHISHFHSLFEHLVAGKKAPRELSSWEKASPIFEDLDIRLFLPKRPYGNLPIMQTKAKLTVLMLSWEYPPKLIGGLARAVNELAEALVWQDYEVHVLTSSVAGYPAYECVNRVHVHRLSTLVPESRDFMDWAFSLNLAAVDYIRRRTDQGMVFDVIHCHDWIMSQAAIEMKHTYSLPLVATIHATEHGRHQGLHQYLHYKIHHQEKRLVEEANEVIVCSEYMKKEVRSLFSAGQNVHVIPNGITLQQPSTEAVPDYLTAALDKKMVFFIARMVREKGGWDLLHVIPRVISEVPDAHFVYAGKGPELDYLKAEAFSMGITHAVTFTGFITDSLRIKLLSHAACSVIPSLYEPFGIVALEAMASGTPVIVSDTGGLSEIVEHGVDGLTIYPGNVHSLEDQLIYLLQNPVEATRMAKTAKEKVEKAYRWDHI